MELGCKFLKRPLLSQLSGDNYSLAQVLCEYRCKYAMRKNINLYRKSKEGTPFLLDSMVNAFDRKIKGVALFSDGIKADYLKGISAIYALHYSLSYSNNFGLRESYGEYIYECYQTNRFEKKHKKIPFSRQLTYKEFKTLGMAKHYRRKSCDRVFKYEASSYCRDKYFATT